MPDRTKEELEQIRKDFVLIKKFNDEVLAPRKSHPDLFDGKSRTQELAEHHQNNIKLLKDFVSSEKIKSCEALTFIQSCIQSNQQSIEQPDYWQYLGVRNTLSSRLYPADDLSLNEIVERLNRNPKDQRLNQNLDVIGIKACLPIACKVINSEIQLSNVTENASSGVTNINVQYKLSTII